MAKCLRITTYDITEAIRELAFGEVLLKVRNGQVYNLKQIGVKYPEEALKRRFYK